jgi:glucose-1-phosphate thymidylyltransferase
MSTIIQIDGEMKGIILAGGSGTRLHPLTLAISKQLLPVYNKPMIYYPISVMMLAGIRELLIISTPHDLPLFEKVLGDGSQLGLSFSYRVQSAPNGIAEAFIIGESFIGQDPVSLILGDNIYYGNHLQPLLFRAAQKRKGATIFGYEVKDPERYGVVALDSSGQPTSLIEKPKVPPSKLAVTGLYFYDNDVINIAKSLKPSNRGELEITDVNLEYLQRGDLSVEIMGRGFTWLDMGTHESLLQASQYIQLLEERQGLFIGSLEEISYRQGWISKEQLATLSEKMGKSSYGNYLKSLAV